MPDGEAAVSPRTEAGGASIPPHRVSLLIGQLGLGGTEKQVALLAEGLRARGVGTDVLVMFEGGPHEGPLRAARVPVVHLGFRRGLADRRMPPANAAAFLRLVGHLRRTRPDVLHAFLFHSQVTAAPAARLAGVPVLVAGRRSLGDYKRGRPLVSALDAVATRMTDHLIANARAVAEDALRDRYVEEDRLTVVPNGLPASAFEPMPPAVLTTRLPVVLCVANLISYKGHRHLLEAMARLGRRGLPCTLALAGDGPERAALRARATRLGVDVRFLGARTDVGRLLARADVVALPSLQEGMSNAVMEAMAAGRPIVATEVGGTGELLRGRGVLVPPADPAALAEGIERLVTDPASAAELGRRARAWSAAHLSADVMVERHVRIYRDLLERRRPDAVRPPGTAGARG
ncbi:glycosyltransferase [Actinoallomurus spadix]|uniref:Glycosyltransferase n=1 Tax=Actinoallomurus spadix TaxID=79912 RepID=A0ABN0WZD1_9ACTN|nr:glycosyltransferase [Actinoallomurus spadix]MCO5989109.1 glycosyltransferase [Actinoallomurus spadix]